jgi:hypothetical protein
MTADRIYFKAKAQGYYQTFDDRQTGPFSFSDIQITQLDLYELEEVSIFDFNDLKTGNFHKPEHKIKSVRVFLQTGKYLKEDLRDILFRQIEKTDTLWVDSAKWIGFTADAYFLIERKIEVKPTIIPSISRQSLWPFSKKNRITQKSDVIDNDVSSSSEKLIKTSNATNESFLLGLLIIFLSFVGVIGLFFGFGGGSILFLVLLGLSLLLFYLGDLFPKFNKVFGVNFFFWNIIGWIFLFFSLLSLGTYGPNNGNISGTLLGLAIILWSRNALWLKRLGQFSFFIVLLFFLANAGFLSIFDDIPETIKRKKYAQDKEFVEDDHIKFKREKDTIKNEEGENVVREKLVHSLNWNDNYQMNHHATISVYREDYKSSEIKRNRTEINESTSLKYWHKVYAQLIYDNKEYLDQVVNTFNQIGKSKQLNRNQFADMIVSGIQNIPYYLVHDLSHEDANRQYGGFITEWHSRGGNCLEKMKFGIQAPAEFMGNFKGDCDTRSVLLFYLLSRFNYDVAILVSEHYGHAILGIAGDYTGKHKEYNGYRYFAWETTATNFVPGVLSPDFGNMNLWQIVLTNN